MSIFRNIRVYPSFGTRASVLTWELTEGQPSGDVFVAFSHTGTPSSWEVLNDAAPIASAAAGSYTDTRLELAGSADEGYYRLMLRTPSQDILSEPVSILGDIDRREYGMARGIMYQEYTMMRATNGYPVWHCIPRFHGTNSDERDPDTGEMNGIECPNAPNPSYGLPYVGGFYDPILTWIRPLTVERGTIKDTPSELSPHETAVTSIRTLAWPRPAPGHMIVDPATDRRYLIGDEIKPMLLRGVLPVAYDANMVFLKQSDQRYRFPVPVIDTKSYRKIPYWT